MDHHGWDEWPEDEPGDTAELGGAEPGLGDTGLGDEAGFGAPGFGAPGFGDPGGGDLDGLDQGWPAGDDEDGYAAGFGAAHDPAAGSTGEPLPDDTFGGEAEDAGLDAGPDVVGDAGSDAGGQPPFLGFDTAGDEDADPAGPDGDDGADDGLAVVDHLVGVDPDVDPHADDPGWDDTMFPPPLGLEHVPEPVDGFPWSDPDLLGEAAGAPAMDVDGAWDAPSVGDLFEYAGLEVPAGGDAWGLLLGSDDPATAALARWWSPGG